jgi:23S rRNA (cytidine1920-2'-O)/16S rRNA (cytidine1409-2'-O)-methyltransferase
MIMAGEVIADERRVDKAGERLPIDAQIRIKERMRFVSRGGDKLDGAIELFAAHGLDVRAKICVDIGASTGGFTDCLLSRGAARIYAVDVGWGQLHARLRDDSRVVVRERTNARHLTKGDFDEPVTLVVVDASFIGIGKLIGAIADFIDERGELVALVKPQFEVGKEAATRSRGVISDEHERARAIDEAIATIEGAGFGLIARTDSAVHGPKGNVEHFVYARRVSS